MRSGTYWATGWSGSCGTGTPDDHIQKLMAFESGGPYPRWSMVSSKPACFVPMIGFVF